MQPKQKLILALTAYAALGFLAWQTMSDEPIRLGGIQASFRVLTLLILGLLAFRTVMAFLRLRAEDDSAGRKQ
ncbi:MAG TPA: hypothetical protein VD837_15615 [Terriglobales bacterium]|nr:hypothetical protein [Terriglobales bacterium]